MTAKLLFFPITIIVFLWVFIGYTKPMWNDYKDKKGDLIVLKQKKAELVEGLDKVKRALAEYQALDGEKKVYIYNALPVYFDEDNFTAELHKNANESGISLIKINIKKGRSNITKCATSNKVKKCPKSFDNINVSLNVVGPYSNIKSFLERLDTQNRLISPTQFSLVIVENKGNVVSGEQSGNNANKLINTQISFQIFSKKVDKNIKLSEAIESDKVMKSLLRKGLNKQSIEEIKNTITQPLFSAVTVQDGIGKDNLFN